MNEKLRSFESNLKLLEKACDERIHIAALERDHISAERDQLIITLRERNDESLKIKEKFDSQA